MIKATRASNSLGFDDELPLPSERSSKRN